MDLTLLSVDPFCFPTGSSAVQWLPSAPPPPRAHGAQFMHTVHVKPHNTGAQVAQICARALFHELLKRRDMTAAMSHGCQGDGSHSGGARGCESSGMSHHGYVKCQAAYRPSECRPTRSDGLKAQRRGALFG